jgi:hypothetical protein
MNPGARGLLVILAMAVAVGIIAILLHEPGPAEPQDLIPTPGHGETYCVRANRLDFCEAK